jgi:hypothetical protein
MDLNKQTSIPITKRILLQLKQAVYFKSHQRKLQHFKNKQIWDNSAPHE